MRRFDLRLKFILLILGLLLVIFSAITLILALQTTATLRRNLTEEAKAFTTLATKPIGDNFLIYRDSGRVRIQQVVNQFTALNPKVTNIAISTTQGEVVFDQHSQEPISVTAASLASLEPTYVTNSRGQLVRVIQPYLEGLGIHRYAVIYDISNASIDQAISLGVRQVLLFGLVSLILSGIIILIFINFIFLRPLSEVSRAAQAISGGQLERQINIARNDEIGDLAQSVNEMAESLKLDIKKLKEVDELKSEFMMISSHNLRTPLTIIDGYLDMLKASKLGVRAQQLVGIIAGNVHRLGVFAEDMLTIASIEAGQQIVQTEPADIAELLRSVAAEFEVMAKEKGLSFKSEIPQGSLRVDLSHIHFRVAVWNLLDNALKFTAAGGQVSLLCRLQGDHLEIQVADSGIGIAPEEIPKLFTKFHRGTSTLTYNYEGTGLGLYITKMIVEQHGGRIEVASEPGEGTTFTIRLPVLTK